VLAILPLASELNPPEAIAAITAGVAERLARRGIAHTFAGADGAAPDAILILTGGTEHRALEVSERIAGPVFLVAHPERNSLPAALEIASRLRQRGRAARILPLAGEDGGAGEIARLARHLETRRRLRAARVGRIGAPSDWLVASTPAPALVTRTWGPTVVDVPMSEVVAALREADPAEVAAIRDEAVAGATVVREPSAADLAAAAGVAAALRRVVRAHALDACTVRCFDLVTDERTTGCLALSLLLDEGIVAGCEGDLPAALTMLWLHAITGEPSFLANPQEIDPGRRTVALAHCTVARRLVASYALRSHFESGLGVGIAGTLPPGPATLARIGGADLGELFAADGEVIGGGASELRCRTQVVVQLATDPAELLARPLGNHHVLARGHLARELHEYHELLVAPAPASAG